MPQNRNSEINLAVALYYIRFNDIISNYVISVVGI